MVGPEEGEAELDLAGGPEGGASYVIVVTALPSHDEGDDEGEADGGLESGDGVEGREDGVLPAGDEAHGEVADDEELDEDEHHEVEGAQDGEGGLLVEPLALGAEPVAGEHPVEGSAEAGGGAAGLGHVGDGGEPEDGEGTEGEGDDAEEVPPVRSADGDLHPEGAADGELTVDAGAEVGVVDGREGVDEGYVEDDVEDAEDGEELGYPGDGSAPVVLGDAESDGEQGGRAGDQEDKGEHGGVVAPGSVLGESVGGHPEDESDHAEDGEDAGDDEGGAVERREGAAFFLDVGRDAGLVGEDPHVRREGAMLGMFSHLKRSRVMIGDLSKHHALAPLLIENARPQRKATCLNAARSLRWAGTPAAAGECLVTWWCCIVVILSVPALRGNDAGKGMLDFRPGPGGRVRLF